MDTLKYKVITSEKQYEKYCDTLHNLVFSEKKTKEIKEEIDLLTLLIESYDSKKRNWDTLNPVDLLRSLMQEQGVNSTTLAKTLEVNKSYISEILNYKKGISKELVRKLAAHFKVKQEAFNRPYKLRDKNLLVA